MKKNIESILSILIVVAIVITTWFEIVQSPDPNLTFVSRWGSFGMALGMALGVIRHVITGEEDSDERD